MAYDSKVLSWALTIFERDKRRRADEQEARSARIGREFPEIAEIEIKMRQSGQMLVRFALSSSTDTIQERIARIQIENLELQDRRKHILTSNGYPADYLYAGPRCTVCGDTGSTSEGMCGCLKTIYRKGELKLLRQAVGSPLPTFADFDLQLFTLAKDAETSAKRQAAYEGCLDFAVRYGSHKGQLFLCGTPGGGKTYIAACVAEAIIQRGFTVIFESAPVFFTHHEDDRFRHSEESQEALRRYMGCDLLIIDDLGTEVGGKLVTSTLHQVLNQRIATGQGMILCSSLGSFEAIARRYSPQIASRIEHEFLCYALMGGDRRKIKRPSTVTERV